MLRTAPQRSGACHAATPAGRSARTDKDTRLQPQQRLEAARDRVRAYTAVYTLGTGKWVQLADDSLSRVTLSEDRREAIAAKGCVDPAKVGIGGQSRIGASLWDAPMRYIENSPLFYIPRVQTPVLVMSNDADGAVPWYQGIELFVALKHFRKEAYLAEYDNEGHNPRKRANQ